MMEPLWMKSSNHLSPTMSADEEKFFNIPTDRTIEDLIGIH